MVEQINDFYNRTVDFLERTKKFPDIKSLSKLFDSKTDANIVIKHFTHNDSDAVGCDVALRILMDNGYYGISHTTFCKTTEAMKQFREYLKDLDDSVKADTVLIFSDIGISNKDDLKELANICSRFKGVIFVDHHKTNPMMNNEIFEMFPDNVFHLMVTDVDGILVSASWLLTCLLIQLPKAKALKNTPFFDNLVHLSYEISNYDTYNFKNRDDLYHTGREQLTAYMIDASMWCTGEPLNSILNHITYFHYNAVDGGLIESDPIVAKYATMMGKYVSYMKNETDKFLDHVYTVEFDNTIPQLNGLKANVIVATHCPFSNDLMEILYKTPEYANTAIILYVNDMMLSFRSAKDGADVSKYAKALGGGGHEHAAGAYLEDPTLFFDILKYSVLSPQLSEDGVAAMKEFSKSVFIM